MKLTIFNGSPRGKNSNSSLIIKWLMGDIENITEYDSEIVFLNKAEEHEADADKMLLSDMSIIIFPLYTDCMPGLVMAFFEKLQSLKGALVGKKIGFIVHSGFPEACHSRYVEKYLVWLSEELKSDYMGTAVIGGSEGFRIMPDSMTRKKRILLGRLGQEMLKSGIFNNEVLRELAGKERYSKFALFIYKVVNKIGLTNFYWNDQLKKNKAYDKRYSRPYV